MLLALLALGLLATVLMLAVALDALGSRRSRERERVRRRRSRERLDLVDPGRERRAERRARELLRSCVNGEEWAMYRELGFIRVLGASGTEPGRRSRAGTADTEVGDPAARVTVPPDAGNPPGEPRYGYLIYPHKPVLAYELATGRLLAEYCVEFPDLSDLVGGSRLPDSDDVLAKWMALTGDEHRLLADANMHLPGRQLDPGRVRRDLWRLGEWHRRRRSPHANLG